MYGVMSRQSGKEKWVFTFSFIMVTMLKVYLMVLKLRIRGSFLKHALQERREERRGSARAFILRFAELL